VLGLAKDKVGEVRRERNGVRVRITKFEEEERIGKVCNWPIKSIAKCKEKKRGRKGINGDIEIDTKGEVGERGWKRGDWQVECRW
jgi:hypothetical protein